MLLRSRQHVSRSQGSEASSVGRALLDIVRREGKERFSQKDIAYLGRLFLSPLTHQTFGFVLQASQGFTKAHSSSSPNLCSRLPFVSSWPRLTLPFRTRPYLTWSIKYTSVCQQRTFLSAVQSCAEEVGCRRQGVSVYTRPDSTQLLYSAGSSESHSHTHCTLFCILNHRHHVQTMSILCRLHFCNRRHLIRSR